MAHRMKSDIIILAAGHGKRMASELPKALMPLAGRPLVTHVIEAVAAADVAGTPILVVGQKREQVMEALGHEFRYVIQDEQLGTGHAVLSAKEAVLPEADTVLVLYADQPFITPETIQNLVRIRKESGAQIAMATVVLPDFEEWRSAFLGFSRVKRNADGEIVGVVENKDATEEERQILEVNPAYFCFDKEWLFQSLPKLKNENVQKEYYLTDLVKIAFIEGRKIPSVAISPREAIGTNSKEDLQSAEKLA